MKLRTINEAKVSVGPEGRKNSWQGEFSPKSVCLHCGATSRFAFSVKEESGEDQYVCDLYDNKKDKMWPHDAVAVAIYFCENCLETTSKYNQA